MENGEHRGTESAYCGECQPEKKEFSTVVRGVRRLAVDWVSLDTPDDSRGLRTSGSAEMTMAQRFTSRHLRKRCSFGYSAGPSLDDQAGIWKLLRPEEIVVQLTGGSMMDPEASVSALVFPHPDCAYLSVAEGT
jgi:hypothetical protein